MPRLKLRRESPRGTDASLRLSGSVGPADRPWRTLVRVRDVAEEEGCCHVVVPAWNAHQAIRLYFNDVPDDIRPHMTAGARLHAMVNIGARGIEAVRFDAWEPE